jgi:hypothetical protein
MARSGDITILYNNQNLFENVGPVPFIGFDQEFINLKDKWNQVTSLTFEGNITGRYVGQKSFGELNTSLNNLLTKLENNYGELKVIENYGEPTQKELFKSPVTIIDSINIDQSEWKNLLPYNIKCTIYDSGLFGYGYGILKPEEKFEFSDEPNKVNFTYTASAQGIRTQNKSAIQNAQTWVLAQTGNALTYASKYSNYRLNSFPNLRSPFLLNSIEETTDRINGSYSIKLDFIKSNLAEDFGKNYLLDYSVDISSGILDNEGLLNVTINGSIQNNTLANLRNVNITNRLYTLAIIPVSRMYNTAILNNPVSRSIEEFPDNNRIAFNYVFNNDFGGNIIKDYIFSLEKDEIKNIINLTLNATIRAKYGDLNSRWQAVQQHFLGENFFNLALTQYYLNEGRKALNRIPESESITNDELNATIKYSATWTDKFKKYNNEFISFSSQITYTPSYNLYVPNTSAFVVNEHNIQDLSTATRAKLTININGSLKNNVNIQNGKNILLNEASRIKNNYILGTNLLRESSELNINQNIRPIQLTLTEVWSFDDLNIFKV